MSIELRHVKLTPMVLNQLAPTPIAFTAVFGTAPASAKLHLTTSNTDLALTPDATGKIFSGTIPAAGCRGPRSSISTTTP
ncbi:MAG TPA: hypothetical protein VIG99_12610 [Myxococcaceae bacterium]|jgi:hypothetical protein